MLLRSLGLLLSEDRGGSDQGSNDPINALDGDWQQFPSAGALWGKTSRAQHLPSLAASARLFFMERNQEARTF
jgi:hypothetical protein